MAWVTRGCPKFNPYSDPQGYLPVNPRVFNHRSPQVWVYTKGCTIKSCNLLRTNKLLINMVPSSLKMWLHIFLNVIQSPYCQNIRILPPIPQAVNFMIPSKL